TTLPKRELSAGLAEIVKYGLILDASFFEWLEEHMESLLALAPDALAFAIRRSCEIKAAIVGEDERERGKRALLNLGHTFGHALESVGGYERWLHGEAVAIGMVLAARASLERGWLDDRGCERIEQMLRRAGLPVVLDGDVDLDRMLAVMRLDKKALSGALRLVLLRSIGRATVVESPPAENLRAILESARGAGA